MFGVDVVVAEGFRGVPARTRIWVGAGAPGVGGDVCVSVRAEAADDEEAVAAVVDRLLAAWPGVR